MARGRKQRNFKKKRKTKGKSKVQKLLEINQRSLSKGQKQHLRDFGELHPVDERSVDVVLISGRSHGRLTHYRSRPTLHQNHPIDFYFKTLIHHTVSSWPLHLLHLNISRVKVKKN